MNRWSESIVRLGAALAVSAVCVSQPAAQATVPPDTLKIAPVFKKDRITLTFYLERQGIAVHSELDRDGRATGKFSVFTIWARSAKFLAAYTDWAYSEPTVAFVGDGRPGVVLLASYVGGLGRDHMSTFTFKLLVLHDGDSAEAFSIPPKAPFEGAPASPSADVASFTRTESGFTLSIVNGPDLSYSQGRLTRIDR